MLKQKTVYIREEDLELWKAVPNKAEFLHDALNSKTSINLSLDPTAPLSIHDLPVEVHREILKVCKHGADPNLCKFKKPGKPCK